LFLPRSGLVLLPEVNNPDFWQSMHDLN